MYISFLKIIHIFGYNRVFVWMQWKKRNDIVKMCRENWKRKEFALEIFFALELLEISSHFWFYNTMHITYHESNLWFPFVRSQGYKNASNKRPFIVFQSSSEYKLYDTSSSNFMTYLLSFISYNLKYITFSD